jgi:hypothetical protein
MLLISVGTGLRFGNGFKNVKSIERSNHSITGLENNKSVRCWPEYDSVGGGSSSSTTWMSSSLDKEQISVAGGASGSS